MSPRDLTAPSAGQPAQLSLPIADLPPDAVRTIVSQHRHTAARLLRDDPATYFRVRDSLAERMPIIHVSEMLHVSRHTVRAVALAECGSVAQVRQQLAELWGQIGRMSAEIVLDGLDDPTKDGTVSPAQRTVMGAIATSKLVELSSEPTVDLHLHLHSAASPDDYEHVLDRLRTGYRGTNPAQTGGEDSRAEGDPVALLPAAAGPDGASAGGATPTGAQQAGSSRMPEDARSPARGGALAPEESHADTPQEDRHS